MYYVYVLQSQKDHDLYIGYTEHLDERVRLHNAGRVKSTKSRIPFILIHYEAFKSKEDATKREVHLKSHQQRDFLRERITHSLAAT